MIYQSEVWSILTLDNVALHRFRNYLYLVRTYDRAAFLCYFQNAAYRTYLGIMGFTYVHVCCYWLVPCRTFYSTAVPLLHPARVYSGAYIRNVTPRVIR